MIFGGMGKCSAFDFYGLNIVYGSALWKPATFEKVDETFRVGAQTVMFILFDCLLDIFSNYDIMYGKCAEISVLSYDCHTALTSPNGQPCFLI